MIGMALHSEQACAAFTRYLLENPRADYMFIDLVDGLAEYLESASTASPALGAFMYFLNGLDYKVEAWYTGRSLSCGSERCTCSSSIARAT